MSTVYPDDYEKTIYSNRVAPALNGPNLNNNENATKDHSGRIAQLSSELDVVDGLVRNGGLNPRGPYVPGNTYAIRDLVSFEGKSYVCYIPNTNKLPTDPSYFQPAFDIMGAVVRNRTLVLNIPTGEETIYDGGTPDG